VKGKDNFGDKYVDGNIEVHVIEWLWTGFGFMTGFIALFHTARDYISYFTVSQSRLPCRCFVTALKAGVPLHLDFQTIRGLS
jgi:hypothetical protein